MQHACKFVKLLNGKGTCYVEVRYSWEIQLSLRISTQGLLQ